MSEDFEVVTQQSVDLYNEINDVIDGHNKSVILMVIAMVAADIVPSAADPEDLVQALCELIRDKIKFDSKWELH